MKNINTNLRSDFLFYLNDGNVIETKPNIYSNQISQYRDQQKNIFQLYRYFIKETS
jgi:hypothetical protein